MTLHQSPTTDTVQGGAPNLEQDVERGLAICVEIIALNMELKLIEKRLEFRGLAGEQVPLQDADRDGRQWLARGTKAEVPVIFASDSLAASFADHSAQHMQLRDLAGASLRHFYELKWVKKISTGKAFRAKAWDVFAAKAPTFLTACLSRDKNGIPTSRVVVSWKDARPLAEAPATDPHGQTQTT